MKIKREKLLWCCQKAFGGTIPLYMRPHCRLPLRQVEPNFPEYKHVLHAPEYEHYRFIYKYVYNIKFQNINMCHSYMMHPHCRLSPQELISSNWCCNSADSVLPQQTFENIQIYDNVRDIQANDLPLTTFADLGAKRVPYFIQVLFRRVIRGYK